MNVKKLERRDSSLDLIRIVSVFFVISVHFLLHTSRTAENHAQYGFYDLKVEGYGPIEGIIKYIESGDPTCLHGPLMFLMIIMKVLFSVCVPLFIILTGYLMSRKTLSRSYYLGIRKTLVVFVLASIACMFFKSIYLIPAAEKALYNFDFQAMFQAIGKSEQYNIKDYILGILGFSGTNYAWYVEMYIGLFLIAPFLNLAYNKLGSKRKKQVLVATMIFLAILPSLVNSFIFNSADWWMRPAAKTTGYQKLIPAFWMSSMYPIAYYFTGAYIREYGIKLKTRSMLPLFMILLFLFSAFSYYRSYGEKFSSGTWLYWYGVFPYVLAVMLFTMLNRVKANNWNTKIRFAMWKVSDITFGMYLLSFIFDMIIYNKFLNEMYDTAYEKLPFYFVAVPLCFIFSMISSFIITAASKGIIVLYQKIKTFVIRQANKPNPRKWQDILFIALMIGAVIFALWKTNYGFGGNDESFYLTVPHRLLKGDALFRDEWNLSQMTSILQLPFVWLYTTITGSTDGIILAARVFYVFVHCSAAVLIYIKLRNYGVMSVVAGTLYFIFTPYNIMALSYDSMGVELVAISGVLLATANYQKRLQLFFSGLAFAGAVLCCPSLILVYPLFGLLVFVHFLLRKKNLKLAIKSEMFGIRPFVFFTLGAGVLAAIFMLFTLSRVGISGIFENLQYMLKDPEHPPVSFGNKFYYYFNTIFHMQPHFKYSVYSYCAMALVMIIDRKRTLHRSVYLLVTTCIVIYTYILILPYLHKSTYNSIMFPLIFIGITSYVLCKNKPKELFAGLFVPGILYSFFVHYTSNQGFYVISMAFAAVNLASLMFLAGLISEMRETSDNITYAVWVKRLSFAMVVVMLLLQGSCEVGSKSRHCFWDSQVKYLDTEIVDGPAAGLVTTEENAVLYTQIYNDISRYCDYDDENLLILSERTWLYLAADKPYGTYSAWLSGEKPNTIERLRKFYDLNPDKKPQYIYVPKESKWNMSWLLPKLENMNYSMQETPMGYALEKIG